MGTLSAFHHRMQSPAITSLTGVLTPVAAPRAAPHATSEPSAPRGAAFTFSDARHATETAAIVKVSNPFNV